MLRLRLFIDLSDERVGLRDQKSLPKNSETILSPNFPSTGCVCFLFLFGGFWLHRQHAEIPDPGTEPRPQQ